MHIHPEPRSAGVADSNSVKYRVAVILKEDAFNIRDIAIDRMELLIFAINGKIKELNVLEVNLRR
ncbi:TPA: hypothetical protein ACPFIV_006679, partial [Klebsiella michiganensis]